MPVYMIVGICAVAVSGIIMSVVFHRLKLFNFVTIASVTLASLITAVIMPGIFSALSAGDNDADAFSLLIITITAFVAYLVIVFILSALISNLVPKIKTGQKSLKPAAENQAAGNKNDGNGPVHEAPAAGNATVAQASGSGGTTVPGASPGDGGEGSGSQTDTSAKAAAGDNFLEQIYLKYIGRNEKKQEEQSKETGANPEQSEGSIPSDQNEKSNIPVEPDIEANIPVVQDTAPGIPPDQNEEYIDMPDEGEIYMPAWQDTDGAGKFAENDEAEIVIPVEQGDAEIEMPAEQRAEGIDKADEQGTMEIDTTAIQDVSEIDIPAEKNKEEAIIPAERAEAESVMLSEHDWAEIEMTSERDGTENAISAGQGMEESNLDADYDEEKTVISAEFVENVVNYVINDEKSVDSAENIDKMGIENNVCDSGAVTIEECIEESYRLREHGDLEGSIIYLMYALDKKPHRDLTFWIVLDICVMYKSLGQQKLALDILNSYYDIYGDAMGSAIREEIERNLTEVIV